MPSPAAQTGNQAVAGLVTCGQPSSQPDFSPEPGSEEDGKASYAGLPIVAAPAPRLVYRDDAERVHVFHGNCVQILESFVSAHPAGLFDMIFADPP